VVEAGCAEVHVVYFRMSPAALTGAIEREEMRLAAYGEEKSSFARR
jgi:hypothetical protein